MNNLLKGVKLDKKVPIPLYYQLKKGLLGLIESGKLVEGDMLPAENILCELFQISRPTVRQALAQLEDEGLLSRHKGKGTFIARPKVKNFFLSQLESFNDEISSKGMTPHTVVLELSQVVGRPECNAKLELPFEEPLLLLSRLRFADGVPVVFLETYLPYKRFECLLKCDFINESLYYQMERSCGARVLYARREIEAAAARHKEAEHLGISVGRPICLVRSVAYAVDIEKPVEYSIARYRGDRMKFSVDTYRDAKAYVAGGNRPPLRGDRL